MPGANPALQSLWPGLACTGHARDDSCAQTVLFLQALQSASVPALERIAIPTAEGEMQESGAG